MVYTPPKARSECQICQVDLTKASNYYKNSKICLVHSQAECCMINEEIMRWCQQCRKLQPQEDFDGVKRTCRARLARHNILRRRKRDIDDAILPSDGSNPGGVSDSDITQPYGLTTANSSPPDIDCTTISIPKKPRSDRTRLQQRNTNIYNILTAYNQMAVAAASAAAAAAAAAPPTSPEITVVKVEEVKAPEAVGNAFNLTLNRAASAPPDGFMDLGRWDLGPVVDVQELLDWQPSMEFDQGRMDRELIDIAQELGLLNEDFLGMPNNNATVGATSLLLSEVQAVANQAQPLPPLPMPADGKLSMGDTNANVNGMLSTVSSSEFENMTTKQAEPAAEPGTGRKGKGKLSAAAAAAAVAAAAAAPHPPTAVATVACWSSDPVKPFDKSVAIAPAAAGPAAVPPQQLGLTTIPMPMPMFNPVRLQQAQTTVEVGAGTMYPATPAGPFVANPDILGMWKDYQAESFKDWLKCPSGKAAQTG